MNQEQIDKLRAAGYTDDDIRDFAATQPRLSNQPAQGGEETLPEVDVTMPSDTMKNAEAAGVPTGARESSFISDFATAAPVILAENAGKFALGGLGAGALGAGALYKRGKSLELEAEKLRQQGIQNRFDAKLAAQQAAQARPPTAPVAPSPIMDQYGRPMAGAPTAPVAPTAPAPQAQPASMASRVQAAAANKIKNLPGASMMGSAGRMAGRLLPGAGTVLNAADAYNRAQEGDYLGAGIAGVGAAASPFPILGTAVGAGAGALNAYRDYLKRQEEEKKRMAQ
jgi:hypothetical protein